MQKNKQLLTRTLNILLTISNFSWKLRCQVREDFAPYSYGTSQSSISVSL